MKRETRHSDKIIANYNKLYKITDPEELARIFFPSKNAHQRRAAFIAIFHEIRSATNQKLENLDHIPNKYGLSTSAVWKARTKMTRLGLIRKRQGQWQYSTVFARALERLIETLHAHQAPPTPTDRDKAAIYVEIAKGAPQDSKQGKTSFACDRI